MIPDIKKWLVVFCLIISAYSGKSQDTLKNPEAYQISLLTISPGTELYSLFGHTAVRVKSLHSAEDLTYNYGTFDFDTPNFMVKFLRGKLLYQLSKAPFESFMYEYNQTKRSVVEQVLDISPAETEKIVRFLENNALPQNKNYLYDFLYDNCSTRVRDIFNKELNLSIEEDLTEDKTFRNMLHEYLTSYPWTRFGIDLIVASRADKLTDYQSQMFLPDYLQAHMGKMIDGQGNEKRFAFMPVRQLLFFDTPDQRIGLFTPFNTFLLISLLLILIALTPYKSVAYSLVTLFSIIIGIGSMVLIFMWFGTDHQTTKINYNLIWMSPLFILLPFLPKKPNLVVSILIILLTTLCLASVFPQAMPVKDTLPLLITILGLNIYFQWKGASQAKAFVE